LFYYDILENFYKHQIKYLIVGGLSVNLYGIPRVTQDIDIIADMNDDNLMMMIKVLKDLGYIPKIPVKPEELTDEIKRRSWIEDKNMKAFSFYNEENNFKVIDILLVHPLDFSSAFDKKTVKIIKDIKIYLASIDDVITMKKFSGRKQDLSDIDLLQKLKKFMGNTYE
jgi:hypothetical protein